MAQDKNELTISSSGMKRFNSIRTGTNIAYSILFILLALLCVVPVVFVIIMFIWAARLLKTMSRDDKYIGYQGQRDEYTDTNYRQY